VGHPDFGNLHIWRFTVLKEFGLFQVWEYSLTPERFWVVEEVKGTPATSITTQLILLGFHQDIGKSANLKKNMD
jgi:hypothetical protein